MKASVSFIEEVPRHPIGQLIDAQVTAALTAESRHSTEDVRSSMDVPPTDNSAVDGYAITSADIPSTGHRDLEIVAELPAGSVYQGVLRSGEALRIMTGAPMPAGADTVYPQEIVTRE